MCLPLRILFYSILSYHMCNVIIESFSDSYHLSARRRSSRALLGQLDVKLLERKLSRIESDGTLSQPGQAQGHVTGQGQGQGKSGGSSDAEGDGDKVRVFQHENLIFVRSIDLDLDLF